MSNRIQEWFSKMVRGLAKQNWEPAVRGEACLYRTADGKACAVGQIISDDAPVIKTGYGVSTLFPEGVGDYQLSTLGLGPISDNEIKFLLSAQVAHDSVVSFRLSNKPDMKENFRKLGEEYQLVWPTDVP